MGYDIDKIRADFPILGDKVYGKPLVYLDNAATTQKPKAVIDSICYGYSHRNANVHRGVHYLSQEATEAHEEAREAVRQFIGAKSKSEIVFTRGTTESVNLVASSFGDLLQEGDEVIVSQMEHHSNIVPWQLLSMRKGVTLKMWPFEEEGTLDLEVLQEMLTERTKLVSVAHASNTLGTVNDVKAIAQIAHEAGAKVMVDGAQSVPHFKVDVQELDCDFLAFSGHKIYGPTGIGVLYGKEALLDAMPPYQAGGEMIDHVTFEKTTYNELPYKFEAGTPDFIGSAALKTALDYVTEIEMDQIEAYERMLVDYMVRRLREIDGMKIYGPEKRSGVVSFLVNEIHPYDMGSILDKLGVAVRTGHHCAQPTMDAYGVPGMVRASVAMYNTKEEIDTLVAGIARAKKLFHK